MCVLGRDIATFFRTSSTHAFAHFTHRLIPHGNMILAVGTRTCKASGRPAWAKLREKGAQGEK